MWWKRWLILDGKSICFLSTKTMHLDARCGGERQYENPWDSPRKGTQGQLPGFFGDDSFACCLQRGKLEAANICSESEPSYLSKVIYQRHIQPISIYCGLSIWAPRVHQFSKNGGTNKVADSAENIRLKDLPLWSWVIMRRLRLLTEAISYGVLLWILESQGRRIHCFIWEFCRPQTTQTKASILSRFCGSFWERGRCLPTCETCTVVHRITLQP